MLSIWPHGEHLPREPLMGDLIAMARALLAVPSKDRYDTAVEICNHATVAVMHRRSIGKMHPDFGDGSIMAVALNRGALPEPSLRDREYRECLEIGLKVLGEIYEIAERRTPIAAE